MPYISSKNIKKGQVFLADLEPTKGQQQRGTKYVVVVSPNSANRTFGVVVVVPLTSSKGVSNEKKRRPLAVQSKLHGKDGWLLFGQIKTINKSQILNGRKLEGNIPIELISKGFRILADFE